MRRYMPAAYMAAKIVEDILTRERGLNAPVQHVLTETRAGDAILFCVMDERRLGKRLTAYTHPDLLHQLSTALKGRRVRLSNHTGLRYAVFLSPEKQLPAHAPFPGANAEFPLGMGYAGAVHVSPAKLNNLLVVGDKGSGKSNFMTALAIATIEMGADLYLADPEEHTYNPAYWNRFTAHPVAGSVDDFERLLETVLEAFDARGDLYRAAAEGVSVPNSLAEYNRLTGDNLPRIVVLADEANSYFGSKAVVELTFELARRSRKWGGNLVLAAHSWRERDVPTNLRSMLENRFALRTRELTSASVVLKSREAAKKATRLTQPGRGYLELGGRARLIQTYLVPTGYQLEAGKPALDDEFERVLRAACMRAGDKFQQVNVAWASRQLEIPYARAQKLCADLEHQGWLEKDPQRNNARFLSAQALAILGG